MKYYDLEKLNKMKELGPSVYPCSVGGFSSLIKDILDQIDVKWLNTWDSSAFEEEAEMIIFLANEIKKCVLKRKEETQKDH